MSDSSGTGPVEGVDRAADTAEITIEQAQHRAEDRIGDARDAATARIRRTEQQVKDKVRRAEAKVREQAAEVERTVSAGLSDPTPAGSVEQAQRQAADLRKAIDADLDTLQARVPPTEDLAEKARTYGGAALGALAVGAAATVGVKQRKEHKRIEREAKAHAAAIARYLPQAMERPRVGGDIDRERGRSGLVLLVLVAAAVGAVLFNKRRDAQQDEPDLWGPA